MTIINKQCNQRRITTLSITKYFILKINGTSKINIVLLLDILYNKLYYFLNNALNVFTKTEILWRSFKLYNRFMYPLCWSKKTWIVASVGVLMCNETGTIHLILIIWRLGLHTICHLLSKCNWMPCNIMGRS